MPMRGVFNLAIYKTFDFQQCVFTCASGHRLNIDKQTSHHFHMYEVCVAINTFSCYLHCA